ncbi:MAG: mannonate dehydratase, partial [Planctomycetales bacterium]|nr:mannonate dehydratase [Planctomycetales bacterium]
MKLGLGLYRHMLTRENLQFARQAGCEAIVAHLVDYFPGGQHGGHDNQPTGSDELQGNDRGWGCAGDPSRLWTTEELTQLRLQVEDAGLVLDAIENLDPAHWHDVLLDGPLKEQHLENVKTLVRRIGEAGIPILGNNFSIAGVCGRVIRPFARGGAPSVGMERPCEKPMPLGMAWNMVVDPEAEPGPAPAATSAQLWSRLEEFLEAVLPVAEASGVTLAAHPDDPSMPTMRGQPRLVYQPSLFQRLLDCRPSRSNALEFCVGTVAEMTDGDVYDAVDCYSKQGAIGYVHLRN